MSFWSPAHTPLWPLTSVPKKWTAGGSFGASRDDGARKHQGIDLYAPVGAPVIAVEDGTVRGSQGWSGSGTKGLWVDHPKAGVSVLYGAVAPGSFPAAGTTVKKGQKIGTIGTYPKGSHMLHIEFWDLGTFKPRPKWPSGDPPETLHDPASYLKAAMSNVVDVPPDSKKTQCGGDVSADNGALDLDTPCSVIAGVEVCSAFNISAWQDTLKAELDSLKGLVLAAKAANKSSLVKGTNFTLAQGEGILNKWGLATFTPAKAVAETSEAARRVRCERLELEAKLAGQQPPQDNQGNGQGGNQGNGGQGNQKPPASGGGGAGLALAGAVVIGAGLMLRKRRK